MALKDGIGGLWHFNTGATDSSGNGNNGTVVGATLDTINQKLGAGCYSFTIDDYIWMANASSLNPGSGDFSIIFWTKTLATARQALIRKTATSAKGLFIEVNQITSDGKIFFSVFDGVAFRQFKSIAIINDGVYHAIGATWENATQTMLIYDNGVEGHTEDFVGGTVGNIDVVDRLEIGRDNAGGGRRFFDGLMDEVVFYPDRALTPAEMLEFYNEGLGGEISVAEPLIVEPRILKTDLVARKLNIDAVARKLKIDRAVRTMKS